MRMGLGIASAALVLLSACGGGGSDEPEKARATADTPARLSLADACPLVYQAVSDSNGGDTVSEEVANDKKLSAELDSLEERSDVEAANAIRAYGDVVEARIAALDSQSATPADQANSIADVYTASGEFSETCKAAGATFG